MGSYEPNVTIETRPAHGNSLVLGVLCTNKMNSPNQKAIYVTCTRDAAAQIHDQITQIGRYTDVKACVLPASRGS